MKRHLKNLVSLGFYCLIVISIFSCTDQPKELHVKVSNSLDFPRTEVVAIDKNDLASLLNEHRQNEIVMKEKGTTEYIRTQWIDYDQDGSGDQLLFQSSVEENGNSSYTISIGSDSSMTTSPEVRAYSRFVPERTDDYTWENDRVAFRTYGPTGQREALAGVVGSTLSSGIDLWLKRTDYSIIDKWYREHVKSPGYYHIDHGEGYDPYHVGSSRGVGGIGIWENDSLLVSENFTSYKTIADGPLRTVFELSYAPWSPYGVSETKRITLDLGSNFSKFEISLRPEKKVPNYAVGITLHEGEGEASLHQEEGWFRHWEKIDDSFVGEGIVIAPEEVDSSFARHSEVADQSTILILTKGKDTLTYYAGFAWVKSGQISDLSDWERLLKRKEKSIESPLTVTLKTP